MADQRDKPFTPPVPRDHADASFSEMVPFRSKKINIFKSPLFIIAVLAAIVVPFLFGSMSEVLKSQVNGGSPLQVLQAMQTFTFVTVFFIVMLIQILVYLYVRPNRSMWVYMIPFVFAAVVIYYPLLFSPYSLIFRTLPLGPGWNPANSSGVDLFVAMFFAAGLCEELLKATPILIGAWLTMRAYKDPRHAQGSLYRYLHVRGPLDGALMGVFAGGGFVLTETGLEYVGIELARILQLGGNIALASTSALLLLLPRVLGAITGHMAYAGIFGYFIGLAVIRPRQKWMLIGIGLLTASLLHAIWNSFAGEIPFGYYIVAGASAVALAAVLLKARQLEMASGSAGADTSGSIVVDKRIPPVMPAAPAGIPVTAPPQVPVAPPPQAAAPPPTTPPPITAPPTTAPPATAPPTTTPPAAAAAEALALNIDGMMMPLRAGGRLDLGAEPALGGRGAGIVGAIIPHPTRANVLGLRNEGTAGWKARLRDGSEQVIEHDQSIRLAVGVEIFFADGLAGAVVKLG